MWGQSLESESPEVQSPEAKSHGVQQQSDLILKGARVCSAECPDTLNLRVPDPVFKSSLSRNITHVFFNSILM